MTKNLLQTPDYLLLDELLSEEHKLIRDTTRNWVNKIISPIIEKACQDSTFPSHVIPDLSNVGAFGSYIPKKYGGLDLDQISYGLIMQELERGDSGIRSTASVQTSLVMFPIWKYGNEKQKQKFLPKLASGEIMGCFGLTEPDYGSNPSGMKTNIIKHGDYYLLNGAKMWISNAPFADIAIVWAKNDEGKVIGLIVDTNSEGFSAPEMKHKCLALQLQKLITNGV